MTKRTEKGLESNTSTHLERSGVLFFWLCLSFLLLCFHSLSGIYIYANVTSSAVMAAWQLLRASVLTPALARISFTCER